MNAGKCNILMLGGAKRVSMARMFIREAHQLGLTPEMYSYELDSHVPVASVAKVITGLRWSDPGLVGHLNDIIARHDIDIVIPFVDGALQVCASGQLDAPSPTSSNAADFFDKREAQRLFIKAGLPIPVPCDSVTPRFPLIAKPAFGSASKGIIIINNAGELEAIGNPGNYVIEEFVAGGNEYTVDCYVTRAGDILCVSPRRRLEVTGGEATRTVTVDRPDITSLSCKALGQLSLTGAVTLQWIERRDGTLLLMEINPRLGGGAVCSVHAGANLPRYIITESLGMPVPATCEPRPGVLVTRYLEETVFDI